MLVKLLCFLIILNVSQQMSVELVSEIESKTNAVRSDSNIKLAINQNDNFKSNNNDDGQTGDNKRVLEIYKIIMIFTCCVLAIVLICFLICILRNSDILVSNPSQSQDNLNLNAVYSNCDDNSNNIQNSNNLLINLPFEKPPSYLDVLKEIGHPPPTYQPNILFSNNLSNQQPQVFNSNPSVGPSTAATNQNLIDITTTTNSSAQQDELILDCNRWLAQSDNERSNLETRLLEIRLAEEYRENLRRLSRDSERCNLPNILLRSHSSPVIRNSLPISAQQLIDANNDPLLNTLVLNACSSIDQHTSLNNNLTACVNQSSHLITAIQSRPFDQQSSESISHKP